jgi:phosphoribosylaminoimidazole-succinocarboxamide synthase
MISTLRDLTIAIYERGVEYARTRGIIIADTKFEFGLRAAGGSGAPSSASDLMLIDEVLTPDSSRFWPVDQYRPGTNPPSFDKQFVRDYLEQIGWNKQPPVPSLPEDVVMRTRDKYLEAYRLLTGRDLPVAS